MQFNGLNKSLIKALACLSIILSLASFSGNEQGGIDENASLQPAPETVPNSIKNVRIINTVRGQNNDARNEAKPKVVPAGKPKLIPAHFNIHKIPESLTVIPVDKDALKTFTPGIFWHKTVIGPGSRRGRVAIQPEPVVALPLLMKENAITNIKYLDVVQGLNTSNVQCMLEDSHGNLWFGTWDGLVKYDGETITVYTEKEGLLMNNVLSLHEDSRGKIWIGTWNGVCIYDGETFAFFRATRSGMNTVLTIMEDSHGNLWFGTRENGVGMYNGETLTHITQKDGLSSNWVPFILEDSKGNMWFSTMDKGVCMYNGKSFTYFTENEGLINNKVWALEEDRNGNIWFGTDGGGVCMFDGKSFTHYTMKDGLSNDDVRSIMEDSQGNLWFGTYSGGVTKFNKETFTHFTKNEGLSGTGVLSIMEDSYGNIWFGTWGGGVSMYSGEALAYFTASNDLSTIRVGKILEDSQGNFWFSSRHGGITMYNGEYFMHYTENEGLLNYDVRSIMEDSHGNLWIGTSGGLCMFDGINFYHFTQKEGLPANTVAGLLEDSQGTLWMYTYNEGVLTYDGKTFTNFSTKTGLHRYVRHMLEDSQGNLWFGTRGGGASKYDGESFTNFGTRKGLRDNHVRSILEDSQGNFWFGTFGGGVSIWDGKSFSHITKKDGLSDDMITFILEDRNHNIWIGTRSKGINRLTFAMDSVSNTSTNISSTNPKIYNYGLEDGLRGMGSSAHGVLLDSKNRLWWGGNGITRMDLNKLKAAEKPPSIQLTWIDIDGRYTDYRHLYDSNDLKIKFDSVAAFNNYPLNLELPHDHNHLTFHFSGIDWSAPQKIKYSFMLEGLDEDWSIKTNDAKADYRNIPQGQYTFKVRAIGATQTWSEPFEYSFKILPPAWLTWWAYMTYGFILLFLILWYRGYLIKRGKINADLKVKEMEVSKMQELDHMKSRFFANISHEFRTPLTLILGPIDDLIRDLPDMPLKIWESLQVMKRNATKLKRLIHQILDISKLETGKVRLQVSEGYLEQFIETISQSFLSLAESKKIDYKYDLPKPSESVFFDGNKLETMLTNLISNAFKNTQEGGQIRINLQFLPSLGDNTPEYAIIKVADTGRGIPIEKLDYIFNRFYQVNDTDSRDSEGTGLGLALIKELVELYRGEISVDSKEGFGSTFTVKLPVSKDLFTEEEIATLLDSHDRKPKPIELDLDQQANESMGVKGVTAQDIKSNKPELLIVEDNEDLRNYLSQNLADDYHILEAINGSIGLDMAFQCIPDLIISDLMMPEMDGMKMIQQIKSSDITNHIPLIILSAKADRDSRLDGLEEGVDDYMIKPFDTEELKVRVHNLIEQRKKLRNRYRREFLSDFEEYDIPPPEDKFLVRAVNCINKHMTESDFNVTQLGKELGLSRIQLYRKFLALTDHTPNEFIRNIRLKMAAKMFHEGHRNITRVLYSVGFNTPAYFAQCFREVYGKNPSDYIKKNSVEMM